MCVYPLTPTMPSLQPAEEPVSLDDLSQPVTLTPCTHCTEKTDDFQCFVREMLTDLHRGQADINKCITLLERNISELIQFESGQITNLENKIMDLEKLHQQVRTIDQQLADHNEMLNKLERFSRRNNVRVIGLPQDKDEDCLSLTRNLL